MSDWSPLAPGSAEEAAERAARESQHQVLIELLGAYADRELPPETTSQIDAHLVGCVRCRTELAIHHAMRGRLGVEPPVAAPPALRERIRAAIAAVPVPVESPAPAPRAPWLGRRWTLAGIAGVLAAAVMIGVASFVRQPAAEPHLVSLAAAATSVPLLRDVLADYRRVVAGDLPGRARDLDVVRHAVPFPIEPLRAPGIRLLASWTTEIGGDPAVVLAYRFDDRIVLEYLVPEERFFQHSELRRAVAGGHLLETTDGAQSLAAWPTDSAGAVLVGDLSADQLRPLAAAALLAGKVERGAP
jgi:anti-sigma factor RsiW